MTKSQVYEQFLKHYHANHISVGVLIAVYMLQSSRKSQVQDGDGGNSIFKSGELRYDITNRTHIEDTLAKLRCLRSACLNVPITPRPLKKQQLQEALLQAFEVKCFDFDRFLKNLCGSRHQFNDFAHKGAMYNEIMRIHNKKVKK